MLFRRKEDHLKDIEAKYKDIETRSNAEIGEIEKLGDADERLKRYQALGQTLNGFNNDSKPGRLTGRKETRAQYGSMGNARALYKLEQEVKEKAEKEAEAMRAPERTAQIQQIKDAEAKANAEIREIEKLDDPAARLERYRALEGTLRMVYSGGRPKAIRSRKKIRAEHGSVGNARAMYKLRKTVEERIEKEEEIISSLRRTAQLHQRFKADFRRELPAKDKTGDILKEVKAEIREDIQEIKKIDDPAVRLERYKALDETIDGFYDGMKPEATDHDLAVGGALGGALIGTLAGMATAIIVCPPAAGLMAVGILGAGVASGATGGAGLGGIVGGKEDRKRLRAKYGSIRNARAMYRLDKAVRKKAEKEAKPFHTRDRAEKLQQQVDEAFNKKAAPAPAPAETAPAPAAETASKPLKLRKQLKQ